MKRRNAAPAVAPYIDRWGRPTYENPCGQNRPNPQLTAMTKPVAVAAPIVVAQPPAATTSVKRDEAVVRAELAEAVAQYDMQTARAAERDRVAAFAAMSAEPAPAVPRAQRVAAARDHMHRRVRRSAVAMLAVIGVVGSSAGAYAYFTASGSGSGSASTDTLQAPTVATTGTVTSELAPGGTADLHMQVTNPNAFSVKITAITQSGPVTNDQTGAGCTNDTGTEPSLTLGNSGVSLSSGQPPTAVTITAVNGASQGVDLANGASMSAVSANACQGAAFTIPVTLTVQTP